MIVTYDVLMTVTDGRADEVASGIAVSRTTVIRPSVPRAGKVRVCVPANVPGTPLKMVVNEAKGTAVSRRIVPTLPVPAIGRVRVLVPTKVPGMPVTWVT